MPITYEYPWPPVFVQETWSGEISIEEARCHWERMLQDRECLALCRSLSDVRDATFLFTDDELRTAIDEVIVPALQGRSWVSAIVVDRPQQLRLAGKFHAFSLLFSQDAVFSDLEEAERWLIQQV